MLNFGALKALSVFNYVVRLGMLPVEQRIQIAQILDPDRDIEYWNLQSKLSTLDYDKLRRV